MAHGIRRQRPARAFAPTAQRGSILLPAGVALFVCLILLGSAEIGYRFYLQRELQKTADLAAIAGAQVVSDASRTDCLGPHPNTALPTVSTAVNQSVRANFPVLSEGLGDGGTDPMAVTVRCGHWSVNPAAQTPLDEFGDDDPARPASWRFRSGESPSSVWVRLDYSATPIVPLPFFREQSLSAHGVAERDLPLASFSVGSRLLDVTNSGLATILRVVGLNPQNVGLVSYEGLATANITPSGLLAALGIPTSTDLTIGGLNTLLQARDVSVGAVLNAVAEVAGQDQLLAANATLLQALSVRVPKIDSLNVQLGSSAKESGIFAAIVGPAGASAKSALDASVSALDIVTATLGIATSGNAVDLPLANIGLPLVAPGLIKLKAQVIEPPVVAIGQARRVVNGVTVPGATAYSAQVRVFVDICIGHDCPEPGVLNFLLSLLQTRVSLPIYVDVASAKGELTDLACAPEPKAQITTTSSLAEICIGRVDESDRFSKQFSCTASVKDESLVKVLGLLDIRTHASLPLVSTAGRIAARPGDGDFLSMLPRAPDQYMRAGETWRARGGVTSLTNAVGMVKGLVGRVEDSLRRPQDAGIAPAESLAASKKLVEMYVEGLPRVPMRHGGTPGAYDVTELVSRINVDHKTYGTGCLLGILCWQEDRWTSWGNGVGNVSTELLSGVVCGLLQCPVQRAVSSGTCFTQQKPNFPKPTLAQVDGFNNCIEEQLAAELLKDTSSSDTTTNRPITNLVAGPLFQRLTEITQPLEKVLDKLVTDTLGLSLNSTDVRVHSLSCYNARLVY